jgi:hypothetical protein
MEAGFGLFKCNFSTGLDLVAINERPQPNEMQSIKDSGPCLSISERFPHDIMGIWLAGWRLTIRL